MGRSWAGRGTWSFAGATAVALVALAVWALAGCDCGAGVGQACIYHGDCRGRLLCGPNRTCVEPDTDSGTLQCPKLCYLCMTCPHETTSCEFCGPECSITCPTDSGTDAAPDSSTVDDSATDGGSATDAGTTAMVITAYGLNVTGNCKPIVPADPWYVNFDATYDNTAGTGSTTATITLARLTFSGAGTAFTDLALVPMSSGPVPPGGSVTINHMKTTSSPDIPNDCGHCGDTVTLDLTWDVAGATVGATVGPVAVLCGL